LPVHHVPVQAVAQRGTVQGGRQPEQPHRL